jgi:hypothetical protein
MICQLRPTDHMTERMVVNEIVLPIARDADLFGVYIREKNLGA